MKITLATEEQIVRQGTALICGRIGNVHSALVPGTSEIKCSKCSALCYAAPSIQKVLLKAIELNLLENVPVICVECSGMFTRR